MSYRDDLGTVHEVGARRGDCRQRGRAEGHGYDPVKGLRKAGTRAAGGGGRKK